MNRTLTTVIWVLFLLLCLPPAQAQESGWPRTLPLEQGMVTIYAPQVDEMSGDIIRFRSALAYRATAGSEPVFGAGWFESRVEIDSSSRVVHPTNLKVTDTRFPAGTADVQAELSAVLAQQSPAWNLDFSLDELEASLQTAEAESEAGEKLNTSPPEIIYRDHPALLISMDGDPVLREIEDSPYKAVINTPYPLIFNGRHYYLNVAKDVWYRAGKATGPYQFEANPPADIAAMVNPDESGVESEEPGEAITAANAPEIVVSTEPAELIVTEGPAAFVPLVDDLLVLQNSDDDVFMHVSAQEFYIVLAGRWYRAGSLNGPWTYQPADELPPAFANIPRDSNQADARVYVAGTEEALDAVRDAQVPQTAAVARGEVGIEVEYDGEPVFEPVDGTELVYAGNTGSTVILSNGLYYLVEDGVWYVSVTPNGPWQVSVNRPGQVVSILPTSPVYNVKYVYIYDSTPSMVYVGYTPGYTGSYVYHNTIFYGSGWHYAPWVSPYYYYPRHSTWGFNVSYNPWSGWNFGLSWGWGPFSVGYYTGGYWHHNHYWHHRHYSHWGPHGYRPRPVHYGRHGYGRNRYAHGDYGRNDYGRNRDGGKRGGRSASGGNRSDDYQRNDNLYRDGAQRARIADTRDKQPRISGRRDGDTRLANYKPAINRQERNFNGQKKAQRRKVEPVSSSDLRKKANVRDANFEARRSMLLADNSGNVYRRAGRGPDRNDAPSRSELPAKGTKNRTVPPPDSRQSASHKGDRARGRARDEPGEKRTRQTTAITSSRQAQSRAANKPARQRPSPAVKVPARRSQAESSNNARRQSPRAVSAPVQRQTSSRPQPQPQSERRSGSRQAAPVQHAPQGSKQESSRQRNRPDRGRNNRDDTRRSRRRDD